MAQPAPHKLKEQGQKLVLELVENADFLLLELPDTFVKVGFAAETRELIENARQNLVRGSRKLPQCRRRTLLFRTSMLYRVQAG